MVRNLLALKNAGATLCGCLDVYNHLSEKYINDVSIRLEKRLKKLTYDRTWPRDTSDAIARYLSLTALRTTKNSPQGSVKMRIDLARGAAILQRRASFKPVDLAMGCMVVNGTRQRLILRGFFLEAFAPEAHFLSNQQQKDDVVVCTARYVIRGAAVLMVDAWKSTVKIECRKADEAERSEIGAKAVLNIQAEMGIEQLYTLLHLSRKHGALLDDHCALLYSFVKKLRSDPESLSNVMEKVETLDRERVAKRGDIWVRVCVCVFVVTFLTLTLTHATTILTTGTTRKCCHKQTGTCIINEQYRSRVQVSRFSKKLLRVSNNACRWKEKFG